MTWLWSREPSMLLSLACQDDGVIRPLWESMAPANVDLWASSTVWSEMHGKTVCVSIFSHARGPTTPCYLGNPYARR